MGTYDIVETEEMYVVTVKLDDVSHKTASQFISDISMLVHDLPGKQVMVDVRSFPGRDKGDFTKTRIDALLGMTLENNVRILLPDHYVKRWNAFHREGLLAGNPEDGYYLSIATR